MNRYEFLFRKSRWTFACPPLLCGAMAILFVAACSSDSRIRSCETAEDCRGSELCQNRVCTPACLETLDCGDGLVCRQGLCVPPVRCSTSGDCRPVEVCEAGVCVPQQIECRRDSECPQLFRCIEGGCYPPGQAPGDSTTSSDGASGSESTGRGTCTLNSDCPLGEACEEGQCVAIAPDCREDRDCPPGLTCSAERCVEAVVACSGDRDCRRSEACVDNACIELAAACVFSDDCASEERCEDGQCIPDVACGVDADCLPGRICIGNECVIDERVDSGACRFNSDCGPDERCDGGECVSAQECVEDRDCSGSETCLSGFCEAPRECQFNSDCSAPGEQECVSGRCECRGPGTRPYGVSCNRGNECCSDLCAGPDGQLGTCTRLCTTNADCDLGDPNRTFFCGVAGDGASQVQVCVEAVPPFVGAQDCLPSDGFPCPGRVCLNAPNYPLTPLTYCSYRCQTTADCEANSTCAQVVGRSGTYCVPYASPCFDPGDCFSGECWDFTEADPSVGLVCTMACNPSQGRDCGGGFACADTGEGYAVCAPPAALE